MMEIRVRSVDVAEIKTVVEVHKSAFPNFFLTKMGDSFLEQYYKSVLNSRRGILFGCYNNDEELLGFCAATDLSADFNKSLIINNCFIFGLVGLKLLFTHPIALIHLVKNLTKESNDIEDDGNYAELLSIGVTQESQGVGVGRTMLMALEMELRKRGVKCNSLTTDYYENDKACGFYHSMGYEVMYEFVTYPKRRMLRYIKQL